MRSINFMGKKLGVSNVFSFGQNGSKKQKEFKDKLEATKAQAEERCTVNAVPTFDASIGIMLPF